MEVLGLKRIDEQPDQEHVCPPYSCSIEEKILSDMMPKLISYYVNVSILPSNEENGKEKGGT